MPAQVDRKKYLNYDGLVHIFDKLNDYPNNEILGVIIDAISSELDAKLSVTAYTATTVTATVTAGTAIATINGTTIYAPAYIDADGVSY